MKKTYLIAFTCLLASHILLAQRSPNHKYFSAVQGKTSKTDSVVVKSGKPENVTAQIKGSHSVHFEVLEKHVNEAQQEVKFILQYSPPSEFKGKSVAVLDILDRSKPIGIYDLRGLALTGLEGDYEAPLEEVFQILDLKTSLGWSSLANHTRPEMQGEEIPSGLFKKSGEGKVTIMPVARYAPPWILPFGFYTSGDEGPEMKQVGILADSKEFHEHQTLFPALAAGSTSFEPGNEPFGFYVVSPTHISFSEDHWNHLRYPKHVAHATRIYPAKDQNGVIKDTYMVCFEEAQNGDYNDYVFMVSNIVPVESVSFFKPLLGQDNLTGWNVFLESKGVNNDPENIFTVSNGVLHDIGKELGYIITEGIYDNYHFKLQFKWGEKKWPPRDNAKRDSGICYHIPEDEENKIWPKSVECQIQEGDVGDFWLLGYSTIEVDGEQNPPLQHSRMIKSKDNELPNGEWNTVEVITFNGTCVHIVNGVVVNYGTNSSLRKGRILLQSEYAELYYRNVEIREF